MLPPYPSILFKPCQNHLVRTKFLEFSNHLISIINLKQRIKLKMQTTGRLKET